MMNCCLMSNYFLHSLIVTQKVGKNKKLRLKQIFHLLLLWLLKRYTNVTKIRSHTLFLKCQKMTLTA